MKKVMMVLALIAMAKLAQAGSMEDCYRSKSDCINYAPAVYHNTEIVVAVDSARYEPRWQAMLDDKDLKALTFLQARRTQVVEIHER